MNRDAFINLAGAAIVSSQLWYGTIYLVIWGVRHLHS